MSKRTPKLIVEHPSTFAIFKEAAVRFNGLRRSHVDAENRLWIGTLATEFSKLELELLRKKGYLSERDLRGLRKASFAV